MSQRSVTSCCGSQRARRGTEVRLQEYIAAGTLLVVLAGYDVTTAVPRLDAALVGGIEYSAR